MVAGVAYLDPGNVASNITGGSQYGYLLIWVVVMGNLIAWVVQYLSAQLGIVTGLSLPEVMGTRIQSRTGRIAYWLQGELVAMATDVACVIGGAVALYLLFGLPLWLGGIIVGSVAIALLGVQSRFGSKPFERVIVLFIAVIAVGFTASLFVHPIDGLAVLGGLVPRLEGAGSLLLAALFGCEEPPPPSASPPSAAEPVSAEAAPPHAAVAHLAALHRFRVYLDIAVVIVVLADSTTPPPDLHAQQAEPVVVPEGTLQALHPEGA
jgi:hypothetical protein